MAGLDPASLLATWERGSGEPPLRRALTLLEACTGQAVEDAAAVDAGTRDVVLAGLLARMAGGQIWASVDCGGCGSPLDVQVDVAAVASLPVHEPGEVFETAAVSFRLPNTADLAALIGYEPAQARRLLLDRCVRWTDGTLPDDVRRSRRGGDGVGGAGRGDRTVHPMWTVRGTDRGGTGRPGPAVGGGGDAGGAPGRRRACAGPRLRVDRGGCAGAEPAAAGRLPGAGWSMNGYLGLLAERTLGVMPTLRPRPRSLFEPGPDSVALEEVAAPLLESPRPNGPGVPAATGPARSGTDHIDDPHELIAGVADGFAATITTPADGDRAGAPSSGQRQ